MDMISAMEVLARAVEHEQSELLPLVDPFIRPIVSKRNLPFMREISYAMGWHDQNLVIDLAFGMPALGWGATCPSLTRTAGSPRNDYRHALGRC